MSDEPTSQRVTRSSKRITEHELGPTQGAKVATTGKRGTGRRGRGCGSRGSHGSRLVEGTETREPSGTTSRRKATGLGDAESILAKKRGPPSPNKVSEKPSKSQKKHTNDCEPNNSSADMRGKPRRTGKKLLPDPDKMVIDEPVEQATQPRESTNRKSGGKGNKYLPPSLDTDSDALVIDNDSDVAPSSESEGERSSDGDVSEPDKQLQGISNNPAALRKKFAEEQSTIDDSDGEAHAGDVTIRPRDNSSALMSYNQLEAQSRPSSRCSNASVSSLHFSQIGLDDDSEDESVQSQSVKGIAGKPTSTTIQQTTLVSKKRTKHSTTKREETHKKEIAKWCDDNEHKEYTKSMRKSSKSRATELKNEVTNETTRRESDSLDSEDTQWERHGTAEKNAARGDVSQPKQHRTDLVYNNEGKINLTSQNEYLQDLMSASIDKVLAFITIDNAYPETDGGLIVCASKITYKVAKKLEYSDVVGRMADKKYLKGVANPAKERISSFRSTTKRILEAAIVHGRGLGELTREEWEEIAKIFAYVDPQLPGKNYTSRDSTKPYEDPLVTQMLHTIYFSKPSSLGFKFREFLPEYDEKKAVSDAMVAFVSTCIHAALDRKYGGKALNISSSMQEIYRDHVRALELIKNGKIGRYKKLMTRLYEEAMRNSTKSSSATPGTAKYIDFSGMDE